jgi:hypothetical protein
MSIRSLAARGLSFAHLAGLSTKAAKAEDDEDKKAARAEGDSDDEDEDKKNAKAEDGDDDKKDDDEKSSKAKSKAESDDDEDAEEDDDKKDAKADDGDDDDDEEMRGKSAAARARRREQARCAAIFASPAAARNPVLAANLAFKTRMTRTEALATLEGTPAPASATHVNRAARNPNLGIDGGAKQSPQQALAARWDQNLKAANPNRR